MPESCSKKKHQAILATIPPVRARIQPLVQPSINRSPQNTHGSPIAVLGAGSWGTALAILIARNGFRVKLWDFFTEHLKQA